MDNNNIKSANLIERAVNEFSKLPGVGKKTALRHVLHILKWNEQDVENFGNAIIELKKNIKYCKICNNITDTEICNICSNNKRDHSTVCIVENINDLMAIEKTQQYNGTYHVLGGLISPMDGIAPSDLNINNLVQRLENNNISEIIFALNPTMEGDTTAFYIYKKIAPFDLKISTIARGVSFGAELEYTDDITLGKSIENRIEYKLNNF